jgi:hypothetical protein
MNPSAATDKAEAHGREETIGIDIGMSHPETAIVDSGPGRDPP